MLSKPVQVVLGIIVAVILLAGAFSGGILVGVALPSQAASLLTLRDIFQSAATQTASAGVDRETLFSPFWQAWDLAHQYYFKQPVNEQALMHGAIRGMMLALGDPHTSYMDPDEYRQSNTALQGEYEGIGAYVDTQGEFLAIIAPMPDSPAEKAGIKTGDLVVAVDGEDMTGVDGNVVLSKILGPAGTDVTLTIVREGEDKPFDVTITRAEIKVPSVENEMLDGDIAHVTINTFGEKTAIDLHNTLKEILAQKPKGLILDLRNNTGGYLDAAIDIVSEFIPEGTTIMFEEYGDGTRKTFQARSGGVAYDIPMVVLVNGGSASASEILAGAVQDLNRAKLVGVTTYGKGSVQNWTELKDQQGAVRITTARWLTPKERQINEVGLEPDYKVEITEEDVTAKRDPQLEKAVELLK